MTTGSARDEGTLDDIAHPRVNATGSAILSWLSHARRSVGPSRKPDTSKLVLVHEQSSKVDGLYECVAPVVNRVVWLYLSRDPERDDIAQDILVAILKGAGSVDDPRKLEAWAARVAHNRIFSVFRRRKILRFLSLEGLREPEPEVRHTDFEGRELLARAQAVLERMPLAERMPFTLQLLGDASLADVAATCGCSERTARRRLKDARERFVRLASRDPLLASRLKGTLLRGESHDE